MSCDTVVIKEIDRQTVEVHSPGPKGDAGQGVATGGISGDLLVKQSASDYDTAWQSTLDIVSLTPDLDPQAVLNQGQMAWNVDDGTVDVGLNGGDVILQVGQEMMYRVENNTGVTIPNGTLCMYEGTVGNSGKVRVKPYDGTGPSRNILGLATKDILNGGFGYVATFGKVRGIQTDGSNYGETWTNGQLIWAAADGGLTNIKPEAPASLARIGGVINAHGSNGVFFVRVRNGSSLADDETVYLVDQADGDALIWNAANERFEPEPVTQPGDNISTLTNDAAYVDSTGAASAAPVQSVDGKTGAVDLSGDYEAKRQNNLTATTNPVVTDDSSAGYEPLSRWINTAAGEIWLCVSAAVGAANWQQASLTLDELGSAALADVGTGAGQVPVTGDYEPSGSAASAQAFAIQRSNHTGTQTLSTISDAGTAAASNIGDFESRLSAVLEEKAITAVDVFVYDTSRDSDGGAWRNRCQHTSWYNEPLNTATRGSRKEFPAVAVIVAEVNKVTIYDGDDPSLPMWMVFNASLGSNYQLRGSSLDAAIMLNGVMCVVDNPRGFFKIAFTKDKASFKTLAGYGWINPQIADRNTPNTFYLDGSTGLVNAAANDVAMTVLPNAPVDPSTGLQIPTIAIATDGNGTYLVSVITQDGTVYDIGADGGFTCTSVAIGSDYSLTAVRSDGTVFIWDHIGDINSDGYAPSQTISTGLLGTVSIVEAS